MYSIDRCQRLLQAVQPASDIAQIVCCSPRPTPSPRHGMNRTSGRDVLLAREISRPFTPFRQDRPARHGNRVWYGCVNASPTGVSAHRVGVQFATMHSMRDKQADDRRVTSTRTRGRTPRTWLALLVEAWRFVGSRLSQSLRPLRTPRVSPLSGRWVREANARSFTPGGR